MDNRGPTNDKTSMIPFLKPKVDVNSALDNLMKVNPMLALKMKHDMTPELIKVGAEESLYDPSQNKAIFTGQGKTPSLPSAIQEYNFAKEQGYQGTFQDFQLEQRKAGASSQNVYGTSFTPAVDTKGNRVFLQPSPQGGQPNVVQGFSPPEAIDKEKKAMEAAAAKTANLDNLDNAIGDLMKHPGLESAVGFGSVIPTIPGTPKADAIASIENLGSRAAIQTINDMKAMSASGGAVGQVSEKEWPKLEAALSNLNRSQGIKQYRENLKKFQDQVRQSRRLINDAVNGESSGSNGWGIVE
jgi:hypothetical protein